jgi:single-stranded-DNA-specific exonuclease
MTHSKESFVEFGGHELAGGFSVHPEKVHFLEESLSISFREVKRDTESKELYFDAKMDLSEVNTRTWNQLEKLAPFGLSNPKPIFLFENVLVSSLKKFGKNGSGEHLEIIVKDNNFSKVKAVAFFSNENSFKKEVKIDKEINLLATMELSRFLGKTELRLKIVDII